MSRIEPEKKAGASSPPGEDAPLSGRNRCGASAGFWGSVSAARCEEAGKPKRRVRADEADQDDFDNAHDALPFFLTGLSRPPMIEG
jgi:hypothetical protein